MIRALMRRRLSRLTSPAKNTAVMTSMAVVARVQQTVLYGNVSQSRRSVVVTAMRSSVPVIKYRSTYRHPQVLTTRRHIHDEAVRVVTRTGLRSWAYPWRVVVDADGLIMLTIIIRAVRQVH